MWWLEFVFASVTPGLWLIENPRGNLRLHVSVFDRQIGESKYWRSQTDWRRRRRWPRGEASFEIGLRLSRWDGVWAFVEKGLVDKSFDWESFWMETSRYLSFHIVATALRLESFSPIHICCSTGWRSNQASTNQINQLDNLKLITNSCNIHENNWSIRRPNCVFESFLLFAHLPINKAECKQLKM